MSVTEVQHPIVEVSCNGEGCTATFRSKNAFYARFTTNVRREAGEAGWDVPPPYGKGSRRGTDFCPEHAGPTCSCAPGQLPADFDPDPDCRVHGDPRRGKS
jgi:hypothetical protein